MGIMKISLALIIGTLCFTSATALSLEDFLGGEPLTRERVVRDLLEYYMQDDPVGIPVLQIPDPLNVDKNVSTTVIELEGFQISGLSQFKLQYVNVNATSLKATVLLRIPRLEVISQYHYSGYWSKTVDTLNVTFIDLDIKITAQLGSDFDAMLQLVDLQVDLIKESLSADFVNAPYGLSVVLSAADTFLDTIISGRIDSRVADVTEKINERLKERFSEKRFPAGINPVDLLVAGLKQDLRKKMDPLKVGSKVVHLPAGITLNLTLEPHHSPHPSYSHHFPHSPHSSHSPHSHHFPHSPHSPHPPLQRYFRAHCQTSSARASNISVTGLSTVHRDGEVSLQLIDDRLLLVLQLGSQAVSVQAEVEMSVSVLPSIVSSVEFTLDSFVIWIEVQQPADVRHPPELRRIHITLGNFRLLSSGESSLSYLLEAVVNGLPNALRSPIIKAIEPLLHKRIQQRLYALDIEEIINKRLAAMADKSE
ncbi:Mite allergen group-7 [Trinorchestia longiramus]|nr:Mite allergen group-7 [Trinorchestia longiramus]